MRRIACDEIKEERRTYEVEASKARNEHEAEMGVSQGESQTLDVALAEAATAQKLEVLKRNALMVVERDMEQKSEEGIERLHGKVRTHAQRFSNLLNNHGDGSGSMCLWNCSKYFGKTYDEAEVPVSSRNRSYIVTPCLSRTSWLNS